MGYFDQIHPDKDMYKLSGKSFSQVLEELDPSEAYEDTALGRLDAFQRQLKRFDIRVSGPESDVVDKFFQTADSAALFPEYVSRAIRQGMEENNILPEIVATTTKISGLDYRSITALSGDGVAPRPVAEGASIPQTVLKTQENLIRLHKRGRLLVASYEAVKFQRLDLFTIALRQIGNAIMASHVQDAVDVLLDGDGNDNAIGSVEAAGDSLAYDDLIALWGKFDPYEMNTLLVSNKDMQSILKLEEFKNPDTGLNFQATGKLSTPLGARLLRSACVPEGEIIGLDRRYALEMVRAGDVTLDSDRLIDRQLERTAVTSIAGFAKILTDASWELTV